MSKISRVSLLAICLLLVSGIIFAQPKKTKTAAKVQRFELGTIDNQIYTNRFFNLQVPLPEIWQVQEPIIGEIIKDEALKNIKGKNTATQKALNQQMQKVFVAFTIFKEVAGTFDNASIILTFEDMRKVPVVKSAVDYLQVAINTYRNLKLPPGFKYDTKVRTETLGNTKFAFLETENGLVRQRIYALFRKGYAVFFTLTYLNDEDLETMINIIEAGNYNFVSGQK